MFILGDEDWRTPPAAGGEDLFRALKYLKRPTVMVRFPGESHELSRSGKPWHRVERLQHIVGWFDKWVMGQENATYDAPSARPAAAAAPAPPPRDPGPPTRANILRGEYGRYRANNDLLSYHLDVRVDPDKKFLSGKNAIRFKMLQDDTRIQLDLYANLKVEKILLGTRGAEVRARAERRLHRLSRNAQARPRVHHRLPLLRLAARDRPLRRHRVPQGSGRPPLDQHRVRRRGLEHLVAEQGPVARRGREHAPQRLDPQRARRRLERPLPRQDRPRRRLHALGLADPLPDQLLQRLAEHRRLRAVLGPPRRPARSTSTCCPRTSRRPRCSSRRPSR